MNKRNLTITILTFILTALYAWAFIICLQSCAYGLLTIPLSLLYVSLAVDVDEFVDYLTKRQ